MRHPACVRLARTRAAISWRVKRCNGSGKASSTSQGATGSGITWHSSSHLHSRRQVNSRGGHALGGYMHRRIKYDTSVHETPPIGHSIEAKSHRECGNQRSAQAGERVTAQPGRRATEGGSARQGNANLPNRFSHSNGRRMTPRQRDRPPSNYARGIAADRCGDGARARALLRRIDRRRLRGLGGLRLPEHREQRRDDEPERDELRRARALAEEQHPGDHADDRHRQRRQRRHGDRQRAREREPRPVRERAGEEDVVEDREPRRPRQVREIRRRAAGRRRAP